MRARAVLLALLLWACGESRLKTAEDGAERGGAGATADARAGAGAEAGASAGAGPGAGASASAGAGASAEAGAGQDDRAGRAGSDEGAAGDARAGQGEAGGAAAGEGGAGADDASSCLDGIGSYMERGPFAFHSESVEQVKLWIPDVPAGCKVPVVHVTNTTGANCSTFAFLSEHLASHGFLIACYESPQPDDGAHCLTALQAVFMEYADRAAAKIGVTGADVGGATALACLYDAEQYWGEDATYAGHAMAPGPGFGGDVGWKSEYPQIRSPVFVAHTSQGGLVPPTWVKQGYDLITSDKYWYEASGAVDLPYPASWWSESALVFFRWKLLGDEAAGEYFAAMPDGDRWELHAQDPAP